jgi:hypothetical protein
MKCPSREMAWDAREHGVVGIQVTPPGLHHPHPGILEVGNRFAEEPRRRDEVRVEDREQGSSRPLEPELERAGLVSLARRASEMHGVDAPGPELRDDPCRDPDRLVRRVVEELDLEAIGRVVERRRRREEPFHDVPFVVDGKLDGHDRPGLGIRGKRGRRLILAVEQDEMQPMEPVCREDDPDREMQREDRILCERVPPDGSRIHAGHD